MTIKEVEEINIIRKEEERLRKNKAFFSLIGYNLEIPEKFCAIVKLSDIPKRRILQEKELQKMGYIPLKKETKVKYKLGTNDFFNYYIISSEALYRLHKPKIRHLNNK